MRFVVGDLAGVASRRPAWHSVCRCCALLIRSVRSPASLRCVQPGLRLDAALPSGAGSRFRKVSFCVHHPCVPASQAWAAPLPRGAAGPSDRAPQSFPCREACLQQAPSLLFRGSQSLSRSHAPMHDPGRPGSCLALSLPQALVLAACRVPCPCGTERPIDRHSHRILAAGSRRCIVRKHWELRVLLRGEPGCRKEAWRCCLILLWQRGWGTLLGRYNCISLLDLIIRRC